MVTLNRKRGVTMSTASIDHASEGKKYLEKGLELVKNGDIDNAVEAFVKAAVAFERAQDFRQIPALWEAVGNLLGPSFEKQKIEWLNQLQEGTIHSVYDKWYQWPLEYRTISWNTWKEQIDLVHRQTWAYQWAAEHRERAGDSITAYRLFLRAAERAERTKHCKNDPNWPGKLYYRAVLNYICAYGTIDNKEIREAIKRMEAHYLKIKEQNKAYGLSAISYRLLKSKLIEAANLAEAEQFKRKEHSALMHYYFHKRNYFRAVTEWLSGGGFMYFIIGLFLIILFVFPYIYYQWNLVASVQGKIAYPDTILYSIKSVLGIGHDEFYAIGYGRLLNIIEAALAWLGLGVFIWWLTRCLE